MYSVSFPTLSFFSELKMVAEGPILARSDKSIILSILIHQHLTNQKLLGKGKDILDADYNLYVVFLIHFNDAFNKANKI